jgi:hypothetical protein
MASERFEKTSPEWMMFQDYWKLCQKYWIADGSDKYWEQLIRETNEFCEKYKNIRLSREIGTGLISSKEYEYKNAK